MKEQNSNTRKDRQGIGKGPWERQDIGRKWESGGYKTVLRESREETAG